MSIEGLEIRLGFIKQRIAEIRSQGTIAPPRTWIHKYYVPKKGKKYWYYRLMVATGRKSKTGSIQGKVKQYLGNARSPRYKEMRAAIERRNEIQVLQRRYNKLLAIYQKALASQVVSIDKSETEVIEHDSDRLVEGLRKQIDRLSKKQEQLWEVVSAIAVELELESIAALRQTRVLLQKLSCSYSINKL